MERNAHARVQHIQESLVEGSVVPSGRIAEAEKEDIYTAKETYMDTLIRLLNTLEKWGEINGAPPMTQEYKNRYIEHAEELIQRYIVSDNRAHRSGKELSFTDLTPKQQEEVLMELIDNYNRTNGLFESTTVASRASLYRDATQWTEIQTDDNIPNFYKTSSFLKRLAQSYVRPREAIAEFERIVESLREMDVPDEFKKDWILRSIATHDPKKAEQSLLDLVRSVNNMAKKEPKANFTELIQAALYAPQDPRGRGRELAKQVRQATAAFRQRSKMGANKFPNHKN